MRDLARAVLIRLGALLHLILPHRRDTGIYFFFPFYHVGGAERVHAEIVKLAAGLAPRIVITDRSQNAAFRGEFSGAGTVWDLSIFPQWHPLKLVLRGYLAARINAGGRALAFGCNTPFFYELLPYLRGEVRVVDLVHAFGGGIEDVSLPYCDRIDRRIVIDGNTLENLEQQYLRCGLPPELSKRIDLVPNKVAVPASAPSREAGERLRVLYLGRGSEEKRAHLVGKIAALCRARGVPADFTLVGELEQAIAAADRQHCTLLGELHDRERIAGIYRESDLLLVTSRREGFPLVIMEGMAHGVVPVATDVGGIGRQLRDAENGFLVKDCADEGELVERFVVLIKRLHEDRLLLDRLSRAAYRHAKENFTGARFDDYYRSLFRLRGSGEEQP